ncbi:putative RNA-directed DNA polymerase [Helianthus debilis subsp. tardiflorus]
MEPKLHPAVTVSNIKTLIPVTLEMESAQYTTWSELFRLQCRAFLVSNHLLPNTKPTASAPSNDGKDKQEKQTPPAVDSWERLDAIVLQWIYGTISSDLLHTIFKTNTTAYDAWHALELIFQDNKATRAIHLKNKFSNTRLENFSNVSAYCQELKTIADQLSNVECPVDDKSLVLQMITGLTEQFDGIATILQQSKPLPSFYKARSQICLEETRKANQASHAATTAGSALHATSQKNMAAQNPSFPHSQNTNYRSEYSADRGCGRSRQRGRGRGRNSSGRGRGNYNGGNQPPVYGYQAWGTGNQWAAPQWPQWPSPPCPYPTISQPNNMQGGNGILGPRPNQAHIAAYTPTNIKQALFNMSLNHQDPNTVMDTRATTHMLLPTGPQDPDPHPTVQQQR